MLREINNKKETQLLQMDLRYKVNLALCLFTEISHPLNFTPMHLLHLTTHSLHTPFFENTISLVVVTAYNFSR